MAGRPSFEAACALYPHRYTMEHIPDWARVKAANGRYYAPHFKTDREWYEHTIFPAELKGAGRRSPHCQTSGQTWPLGLWLDQLGW